MAIPGERFEIDLSAQDYDAHDSNAAVGSAVSDVMSSFVSDVKERTTSTPKPPSAPKMRNTSTGFPEHRKRGIKVSAFKQQQQNQKQRATSAKTTTTTANDETGAKSQTSSLMTPTLPQTSSSNTHGNERSDTEEHILSHDAERQQIDEENSRVLASMSSEEIEEERRELLASFTDTSLLERLLKRADIDQGRGDTGLYPPTSSTVEAAAASSLPMAAMRSAGDDQNDRKAPPFTEETTTAVAAAAAAAAAVAAVAVAASVSTAAAEANAAEAVPIARPQGKLFVARKKTVTFSGNDDDAQPAAPIDLHPASVAPARLPASRLPPWPSRANSNSSANNTSNDHAAVSTSPPRASSPPPIHFPQPAPTPASASASALPPSLDPAAPGFLSALHATYFPTLAADPARLAWMAPLPAPGSRADAASPYSPAAAAARGGVAPSALRFDFRGQFLPPRIARAMRAGRGLHHHGEAPEAAGYTLPELARLARAAVPAQRCLAFAVLGRVMYRLGRGEWDAAVDAAGAQRGDGGGGKEGRMRSEMTEGLWRCVEEGRVLETLEEAARREGGHAGSRAYAVEALWLWRKGGGGRVWKAG